MGGIAVALVGLTKLIDGSDTFAIGELTASCLGGDGICETGLVFGA